MIVQFSSALRRFVGNQSEVRVEAQSLPDLFSELSSSYPELAENIFAEQGKLRTFIALFVDGQNVQDAPDTAHFQPDTVISIVPSIAGG